MGNTESKMMRRGSAQSSGVRQPSSTKLRSILTTWKRTESSEPTFEPVQPTQLEVSPPEQQPFPSGVAVRDFAINAGIVDDSPETIDWEGHLKLTDMPPEVIRRICEMLLPDRSIKRPGEAAPSWDHIPIPVIWSGPPSSGDGLYPIEHYTEAAHQELDVETRRSRLQGRRRPENLFPLMVNRTEQQPTGQQRIFVNDLASFASTCKLIANSARSVPLVRHFVVTICHGQMAFEGIRSAEPQQTYTTAIPGEWIMVNKDTNTHTHTLGIMPLAQIPGNVAFNNLANMLSRIQHLTINIELDSPVMMVSKPEFFLADNIPRTEISTFAKEELWCQKIGELLWSASGSLSRLSSLDIVIKVHFEGVRYYLNRFLQQNPDFIRLRGSYPPQILTKCLHHTNQSQTIGEAIVLTVRDILDPLVGPLARWRLRSGNLNLKVFVDGDSPSNNWGGVETAMNGRLGMVRVGFGEFDVFCSMLQEQLCGGSGVPKAQNVLVEERAFYCQLGLHKL
ncbi:hypothetical protein LTS15_001270 [Exophiala xenobiotica]|nr:hypothetical protein LTS15_001270 [Exophiala xenobiotica]